MLGLNIPRIIGILLAASIPVWGQDPASGVAHVIDRDQAGINAVRDYVRDPASGIAHVVNGAVTSITLTKPGAGYTAPPPVFLVGGGGDGAAATARLNGGKIQKVIISDEGKGYSTAPLVVIAGPVPADHLLIDLVNGVSLSGLEVQGRALEWTDDLGDASRWQYLTNGLFVPGDYWALEGMSETDGPRFFRTRAPLIPTLPRIGDFSPRWQTLWSLPAGSPGSPLIVKKVVKGEKTEPLSDNPLQALIWQPLEPSGRFWARHYLSSSGGDAPYRGCARILRSTYSELYASTDLPPSDTAPDEFVNRNTGVQAYSPAVVIGADAVAGRTELGTMWADYSEGTQPLIRFSIDPASAVSYVVQGASRLVWRSFGNPVNGGRVRVQIFKDGQEISPDQYEVGQTDTNRLVNLQYLISELPDTRLTYAPLARNLDPASTYTVNLTLFDGVRLYDAGLLGYQDAKDRDGYKYDAVGYSGLWDNYESFSHYAASVFSGSRHVTRTAPCTRIDWRYIQRVNACVAGVRIYDEGGTEIDVGKYRSLSLNSRGDHVLDTFSIHTAEEVVVLADGLPEGVYYVHIFALPDSTSNFQETYSASYLSSRWAVYDGGIVAHNTAKGGVVGVDSFVDNVQQFLGGGSDPLDAAGNFVFAGQVRDPDDAVFNLLPEVGFVSATHGGETLPDNIHVRVDGKEVPWEGSDVGTSWSGSVVDFTFTTHLGTQAHPTHFWANCTYRYIFSRQGLDSEWAIETTRPVNRGMFFANQNIAPNPTARNGTKLGGGFGRLWIEPGLTLEPTARIPGLAVYYPAKHEGSVFYSPEGFGVALTHVNPDRVWEEFNGSTPGTLEMQRTRTAKTYAIVHYDSSGNGKGLLLPAGWKMEARQRMRLFDDSRIPAIFQ